MKRILFHSLTIPPDNVSTGMLVAELAAGFNENNIKVEILASTPQYNFEKSKPNNLSIIDKQYSQSEYKGVKIYHVNSKTRSLKKLEGYFSGCDFIITLYVFYTRQEKPTNIFLFLVIRQQ